MPKLSIFFIRTSLIYFIIGITIGAVMLADKGLPFYNAIWTLRSAHIELALLGWIVQLIMGTAYWILPRHPVGEPRGNIYTAWSSYTLLNAGIIMGIASIWFLNSPRLDILFRLLQFAGIGCFAYVIWPRVLTFKKEG